MKKIKLLLVLFLGVFLIPNICYAADDVYIESVDVLEKSDNTEVVTPASFSGLNINFDVKFVEKDDYILYKVVVVNNSNKPYRITNTNKFKSSDYIRYDYIFNNNGNIVKAKSKQSMNIKITYQNLVPQEKMNADGTFTETKNMLVSLARGSNIINNPKTSSTIIALLVIMTMIVCASSIIGIRKRNKVTSMLLIIGITFLSLPITILAIESLQIKVNSKVTIDSQMEFCVYDIGLTSREVITSNQLNQPDLPPASATADDYRQVLKQSYRYKARKGMTYREFIDSSYFDQVGNETPVNSYAFSVYDGGVSNVKKFFDNNGAGDVLILKRDGTEEEVDIDSLNNKIYSCDEAVYGVFFR